MRLGGALLTATLVACAATTTASGATLERLSFDEMVTKSTSIVRGRAMLSANPVRTAKTGLIYTHYTIEIAESWKGTTASRLEVAVPGGTASGMRQTFPGTPELNPGTEYVFFLWTSRSGLTQIIGLSQGLLSLKSDSKGKLALSRAASTEPMVDRSGNPVSDQGFTMTLSEFRAAMNRHGLAGVEK